VRVVFVCALAAALCVFANAEAGPGNEEEGQELPVDQAYQEHVSSIFSAIMMQEGKSNVKYSDMNPQNVDIHTILPRVPAVKVGMNAMGHKMMHIHSDERGKNDKWSAEILSSGATAGFTLTDRVKGLQKGDGKAGSQWSMYSHSKTFRVKDEGSGDILQLKDGTLTLKGNKGKGATKPRFTIVGGKDSVARLTLVSKVGGDSKFLSLYNRYGKFGVFSGATDKSIFHISADGSEAALTSANVQPHVTIESTAKGASTQELILKGHSQTIKMFHKSGNIGYCGMGKGSKKCTTFYKATADGQTTDFMSQADKAVLRVSHKIRGGNSALHLISQNKVGVLTNTQIHNTEGTFGVTTKVKGASKKVFSVASNGAANVYGTLNTEGKATFQKDLHVLGSVEVKGIVTMQGKNVGAMLNSMEEMRHENLAMRARMDDMERESKETMQRVTEMAQQNMAMKEQMETMMASMQLMQETQTRSA